MSETVRGRSVKPRRKSVVTAVIVVTIANAVLDPDLVFADEPTSGLDPVSTQEIDEMFIRLTRRIGAAAVVVTHDIASFFRIAHRAIMLGGERDGALRFSVNMNDGESKVR
jgi:ABC-type transporter Mla maintaining outer membrane lipid asymmetry ATPase subunit MlaF